jgi:hypothetical protein
VERPLQEPEAEPAAHCWLYAAASAGLQLAKLDEEEEALTAESS